MQEQMTQHDEKQLVVFELSSEVFGVDIGEVREIIRLQEITKVPRAPEFVEGVINLRGKVIPVIDLRKRFELPVGEKHQDNRIVVVEIQGNDIGVVVDAVTEVLRISSDSIEPPSTVIITPESECLLGIARLEDKLIILLDLQQLLSQTEQDSMVEVDIAAKSSQVSRSVEEMSASAGEISSQVEEIAASAENMDNKTKELQEVIGKSKLNGPRLQ